MSNRDFLPERKERTCRRAGALFLIAATYWAIGMVLSFATPGMRVTCELPAPCQAKLDPVVLLSENEQAFVARDPAARARVDAWAMRTDVRLGLGGIAVLEDGPIVVLMFAVGMALRRLGTKGEQALAQAVPWLKHAARAGIVWAILRVFTHGLRSLLLAPGTGNPQFPIALNEVPLPLLLGIAAYVIAWALEGGIKAKRDLATFV